MTPDEARTLICPMWQPQDIDGKPKFVNCAAYNCMSWSWTEGEYWVITLEAKPGETLGNEVLLSLEETLEVVDAKEFINRNWTLTDSASTRPTYQTKRRPEERNGGCIILQNQICGAKP